MAEKSKLTTSEKSWILYDVGNSAFTMLACSLIPIWFKDLAIGTGPGQITGDQATAYYAIAISVVTVIVAVLGPITGVLADHKGKKKIFFTTTVALGVVGCILNGFATSWVAFILIYVFARIFYQMSLVIYDSMLNDVTVEERMDEVSSYGYAWGYIGSCIPFIVAMVAYILSGGLSEDLMWFSPQVGMIIGYTVTGLWWFAVTVPLIKNYKQVNYTEAEHGAIAKVFSKIGATLKKIATQDKKVLFFLIAFFLYIDGVG
ncbi:MAG: MFS transporter, partial [Atopobiaceae bacterium]|nr:MFS transporter [Atopobiaceae bacterium]